MKSVNQVPVFLFSPVILSAFIACLIWISAAPALALDNQLDFEQVSGLITTISVITAIPTFLLLHAFALKRHKWELELTGYATTDPLTGVLNRRAFLMSIEEEQTRMRRTRAGASILLFDLDFFKRINDQFGHSNGDEVLKTVCEIAHSELRGPFDRIGRWGGEEFVILLHNLTRHQAAHVAERLRLRIQHYDFAHTNGQLDVTASFGVAPMTASCEISSVFDRADEALYIAKAKGRNRVVLLSAE